MNLYIDFIFIACLFIYNYWGKNVGPVELTGLLLGLPSYLLWITARIQLGNNFTVLPKANGFLVTGGLYSKLRNPVYVFSTLSIFGSVLPSKSIIQYSFLIAMISIQFIRSKKEGEILLQKYGKEYIQYKKETWF